MKLVRTLIFAAALMAGLSPAIAQQFPTVPTGTFLGRSQIGSGPSQAIPFTSFPWKIGSNPISGGANGQLIFDNNGRLGEYSASAARTFLGVSGIFSVAGVAHQWLASVTNGVPNLSQPSFSDLLNNIAVSQMNSGTNASASTVWAGNGAWSPPQTFPFTAANSSPATQTLQSQLQKIPVTCEDFAVCGTSDDSTTIDAAMAYAAANGKCFSFNGKHYTASHVLVSGVTASLCLKGPGGLTGAASGTFPAVLEIKNSLGVTMDGTIDINCNSNAGYTAGFKLWSDGTSSSQFNKIAFNSITNCKLAKQYGDASAPSVPLSEITDTGGFFFNVAQGVEAIGSETVLNFIGNQNVVDNTNWSGTGAINWYAIGATINVIGGESVNTISTTGDVAVVQPAATSVAPINPYGVVNITASEIEFAGQLVASANPNSVSSPITGGISIQDSFGFTSNVATCAIQTTSDFPGIISTKNNRFFAGSARSAGNICMSNAGATAYFDLQSFGANFLQGYAGVSGGIQRMTSKDLAAASVTTTATNAGESLITFNCASACTYTLPNAAQYPGRTLYLSNIGSTAVTSASSNILALNASATSSLFGSSSSGKFLVLVSDQTFGNFWRIVSGN